MAEPADTPSAPAAHRASAYPEDPGDAFITACLAPLPPGAAPVDVRRTRFEAKRELKKRWLRAWLRMKRAKHIRGVHSCSRLIDGVADRSHERKAFDHYVSMVGILMEIPAPTRQQLRWKRDHRRLAGGRYAWEEAIARDEWRLARLAGTQ